MNYDIIMDLINKKGIVMKCLKLSLKKFLKYASLHSMIVEAELYKKNSLSYKNTCKEWKFIQLKILVLITGIFYYRRLFWLYY